MTKQLEVPEHSITYNHSHGGDLSKVLTFTGVMGVGKGYVLTALKDNSEYPQTIPSVSFGDLLTELAGVSRDELRNLDSSAINILQMRTAQSIKLRAPVILDSHVVPIQNQAIMHNPMVEKAIRPAHYIALIAEPETIIERRHGDPSRKRVEQNIDEISIHQKLMLAILHVLSDELGSGLSIIRNDDVGVFDNINMLLGIMREEHVWLE